MRTVVADAKVDLIRQSLAILRREHKSMIRKTHFASSPKSNIFFIGFVCITLNIEIILYSNCQVTTCSDCDNIPTIVRGAN